jgi:hypothetical protein
MGCCSSRSSDSPATRATRWRSTGIVALRDARLKVWSARSLPRPKLCPSKFWFLFPPVPIPPGFTQFCARLVILVSVRRLGVCRINMWWWMDCELGFWWLSSAHFTWQSISSTPCVLRHQVNWLSLHIRHLYLCDELTLFDSLFLDMLLHVTYYLLRLWFSFWSSLSQYVPDLSLSLVLSDNYELKRKLNKSSVFLLLFVKTCTLELISRKAFDAAKEESLMYYSA